MTPTVYWGTGALTASLLVSIHEYDFYIYFEGLISVIQCCMYVGIILGAWGGLGGDCMLMGDGKGGGGGKVNCFQKCGGHGSRGSDAVDIAYR